ncbi:MAG: SDR family NAD(P)-dependent oxidoreductase, partial [Zavarzinia sp.]|nr:SDR family NAD(P)-dependent oxidoreductase [Zavarzinia sp.]
MPVIENDRRTLILTGASRGIGHATVKRFSSAGWRVITLSRQPFPENCPWAAGPEDHVQIDLADIEAMPHVIEEMRSRLIDGRLDALVNNAGISPKGEGGSRLGTIETEYETWDRVFRVN